MDAAEIGVVFLGIVVCVGVILGGWLVFMALFGGEE
jgi:hypothetical protein